MGCFVYIAMGSTAEIAMGPTAILSIITLTYTRGKPVEYAVILCLLTGIVTLLMGLLQLGKFFILIDSNNDSLECSNAFRREVESIISSQFFISLLFVGFIVNFISTPVNSGFTSAAAITICSTQLRALLGLTFKADGVIGIVSGTIQHITELKPGDAILSLICSIVLLFLMVKNTLDSRLCSLY